MRIYFSGIGGVGIGPLAEIAHDAGYDVTGSDAAESLVTKELQQRGINVHLSQDGESLRREHQASEIGWFVYTSALPPHHPELLLAKDLGIRTAKRDELIAQIIKEKQLKLIAVSGTHGKTTTTGMLVWVMQRLGLATSYSIGTTLNFGPSGQYVPGSKYFIYECDEFDRNFLHFEPHLSLITSIDHDHFDTYPTRDDYTSAFIEFLSQSDESLIWSKDLRYLKQPDIEATYESYDELMELSHIKLAGQHNRQNAFLVQKAMEKILNENDHPTTGIAEAINSFPGTNRRFEKLGHNLYSDYGHHPVEIAATLQMAREISDSVVLVYQPHQNIRQHEIADLYTDELFADASQIYWLPTYLSREDPELEVLSPQQLTRKLSQKTVSLAEMDNELWQNIERHRQSGHLVLGMGAGSIDNWMRSQIET